MTDYYYDDDNEAWDGYEDDDAFDCGMVDDKRLCADIGSEHCSFYCPFHQIAMARNPDDYPAPDGYEDEEPKPYSIDNYWRNRDKPDDMDDIPF